MTTSTTTDPYQKTCLHCKNPFKARRTNMDYCKGDCKKLANNGKAARDRKLIAKIDKQLKLNRKILEHFFNAGKKEITSELLQINKFDFTKHTELAANAHGERAIPVYYNYSLENITNKTFKINKLW